jgi:hypothetical protein
MGDPPYVVRHVNPREHYINETRYWTPFYSLETTMNCSNCGYRMRFIAGRWVCDSCTHVEVAPEVKEIDLDVDAPVKADVPTLHIILGVGRELFGENFSMADASLTHEQEVYLLELDLEIQRMLLTYRTDTVDLLKPNLAPYVTDSSRPLGY